MSYHKLRHNNNLGRSLIHHNSRKKKNIQMIASQPRIQTKSRVADSPFFRNQARLTPAANVPHPTPALPQQAKTNGRFRRIP
jgi:hypothetical protein